jgi:hypothetical protein
MNVWSTGGTILKKTTLLGENTALVPFSIINPTWFSLETNPDLRGEKPAANALSNGLSNFQEK